MWGMIISKFKEIISAVNKYLIHRFEEKPSILRFKRVVEPHGLTPMAFWYWGKIPV